MCENDLENDWGGQCRREANVVEANVIAPNIVVKVSYLYKPKWTQSLCALFLGTLLLLISLSPCHR